MPFHVKFVSPEVAGVTWKVSTSAPPELVTVTVTLLAPDAGATAPVIDPPLVSSWAVGVGRQHGLADHRRAVGHLAGRHGRLQVGQRGLHGLHAGDFAHLLELTQKLGRVGRLQRVLVLELGRDELQEIRRCDVERAC